jgi:hypothetical protein
MKNSIDGRRTSGVITITGGTDVWYYRLINKKIHQF